MIFWVDFTDKASACVEGASEQECRVRAAAHGNVARMRTLPYPAAPRLHPTDCPSFCYRPTRCAGHTSCPNDYACTE